MNIETDLKSDGMTRGGGRETKAGKTRCNSKLVAKGGLA
jgi:hypothetical protein